MTYLNENLRIIPLMLFLSYFKVNIVSTIRCSFIFHRYFIEFFQVLPIASFIISSDVGETVLVKPGSWPQLEIPISDMIPPFFYFSE